MDQIESDNAGTSRQRSTKTGMGVTVCEYLCTISHKKVEIPYEIKRKVNQNNISNLSSTVFRMMRKKPKTGDLQALFFHHLLESH